jgi:uncharacterized protein (DUF342 family)
LRGKLGAAEQRQVELNAEILEISYAAHTGDLKAAKRLREITTKLAHLTTEVSSLTAALAEGARRELEQREQELAARRRADAERADVELADAESLALEIDRGRDENRCGSLRKQDGLRSKALRRRPSE